MATTKEYPVKIRKIPVLDKKTGITYFEIRRTRYDPVRKFEVILSSERTGEKLDPEAGEVVACRPKRGTKRASACRWRSCGGYFYVDSCIDLSCYAA